jgi:hypothetical protein
MVISMNVRRISPQWANFAFNLRPSSKQHSLCRSGSGASMEKEWKAVMHLLSRNTLYCYEMRKAGGSCVEPSPHENFT